MEEAADESNANVDAKAETGSQDDEEEDPSVVRQRKGLD